MRAVTVNEYGAEPALMEAPDPQPGPEQALIKVEAAGVNPLDRVIADGGLKEMMPASFPLILGADLTGVIEAGGDGASNFSPGEEAFGQLMIAPLGSTCVADTEALAAGGVSGVNSNRKLRADCSSGSRTGW